MTQPAQTNQPKTRRVAATNVGLLCAAEIVDKLKELPDDDTRRRVLGWVNDEFAYLKDGDNADNLRANA